MMQKSAEVLNSFGLRLFACVLAILLVPATAFAFSHDELLPDAIATFTEVKQGGSQYLYNYHKNPANAVSGNNFPTTWQTLVSGQDLRLKVLLPPGVNLAGVSIESPAMVANFGVCDGVPATCAPTRASPPMLWPIGATAQTTLAEPRIVSFVVAAQGATFTFSTMTITYYVADITLYEAWRKQRSWAGGSGDCDGLSGAFCNNTSIPTTPTTPSTFSLTPATQNVMAGGVVTLTAQNGAIASCISNSPTVVASPLPATSGGSATSTVAVSATSGTQVTITCTSTGSAPTTATATITVTAPTFAVTPSAQQVVPGGNYTLTAQNGTIDSCTSTNSSVIPKPTVAAGGATAAGSVVAAATVGSQATVTCLSTAGGAASATITVSSPATQTQALSLSGLGLTKLASTSAEFAVTLSAAATGYWVAFPYTSTAPTAPSGVQVKAGQDSAGAPATLKGSDALVANAAKAFSLSGLAANASYQVFFYAEDASGGKTSVVPLSFVTNVADVVPASFVAKSSGTNDNLVLSVTVTPASNATGTKQSYIAALVPTTVMPPYGGLFFLTKAGGWAPWTGGALPAYQDVFVADITILDGKLPVGTLVGTDIFAAYGIGDDLTVKKIYTVVK